MKKIIYVIIIMIITTTITTVLQSNNNKNKISIKKEYTYYNFYKKENNKRYINYESKNKNINTKQIIINVNIGLDYDFYTNVKKTKYLNKNYVLVNKYNYLNSNYIPNNLINIDSTKLIKEAATNFIKLKKEAKKNNLNIYGISGYRSYNYQSNLYNNYVKKDGYKKANKYSAKPGYSEHQTGLAIDVSNIKTSYLDFETTKEYIWMENNAYKYGFILRYPKNKEKITGYIYESWHYRYVGEKISTYIKKNNITFEEYYVMFIDI